MVRQYSRRHVLQMLIAVAPLLAGCTVSGSVQQQQEQALANATPTATVGASPTAVGTPVATPSAAPTVAPTFTPGGKAALRFGAAGSSAELAAYANAATAYAKATPNTTVSIEHLTGDGVSTLQAALAADTAPDLVTVPWDQLAAWSSNGALDDLTALLGPTAVDLSGDYSLLQDYATVGGRTMAFPLSFNPRVLYVNLDVFGAAGLQPPGATFTWSAFEAAAAHVSGSGHTGFAAGTTPFDWLPWVWAAGGSVFDDDLTPTTCTVTDAPSVSGLQRYADLWLQHRGATAPSGTPPAGAALAGFLGGTVGMIAGDRSTLASLAHVPFKWQVTYLPQGPGGHATTYTATLVGVSKSSRQPLVAGHFAGYLATDKAVQGALAKTDSVVPTLRSAAESAAFKFSGATIDDAVFTQSLLFADQPPRTAAWSQIQSAWNPDLQKLWTGQQSATDAAKALAPKVDAALKQVAATPTAQPFAIQVPRPTPTPAPVQTVPAVPVPTKGSTTQGS